MRHLNVNVHVEKKGNVLIYKFEHIKIYVLDETK